jgi:glycosyltransferase involved in cell wall biosynthesis
MISLVMAVHNGAKFIAPAIRSALAQTLPPDEVIVVDDGSGDDSAGIAARFGGNVRVLRLPHRGGSAALNAGVTEARGDTLAFLDADDLWAPDKLTSQAVALAEPAVDAVFGRVVNFTDPDCEITEPGQIALELPSLVGASKIAMLIRRVAFDHVGAFNESLAVVDFGEWYVRALGSGIGIRFVDRVIAFRRIHRHNATRLMRSALHRDYMRIARGAVSRAAAKRAR